MRCSADAPARRSSPIPTSLRSPARSAPPARASRISMISPPLWRRPSVRPDPRCSSCAWACRRRGSSDTLRGYALIGSLAVHLRQEFSQLGEEPGRVVALDRVSRVLHAYPAAARQPGRQALGVLVVEDIALSAAHHEGRTLDRGGCVP